MIVAMVVNDTPMIMIMTSLLSKGFAGVLGADTEGLASTASASSTSAIVVGVVGGRFATSGGDVVVTTVAALAAVVIDV